MKNIINAALFLLLAATLYAADNNIIAQWDFSNKDVLKSRYALVLRGTTVIKDNALTATNDNFSKPAGAVTINADDALTPENAFKIEAVINLDKDFKRTQNWGFIYDSKYVSMPVSAAHKERYNCGFMFFLQSRGKDLYRLAGAFGYGDSSAMAFSKDFPLAPGRDHTVAMHFTGTGKVNFYLDGNLLNTTTVPAGVLARSQFPRAVLGDRIGSNYAALGGVLKKLVISRMPYQPLSITVDPARRQVFERGEKDAVLYAQIRNGSRADYKNIILTVTSDGKPVLPARKITQLAVGKKYDLELPVDSRLLPGTYQYNISAADSNGKVIVQSQLEYTIVKAYGDFMPVIMWGTLYKPALLKEYGFTHELLHFFPRSGNFSIKSLPRFTALLDDYLKHNFYAVGSLYANYRFLNANRYLRTDRNGKAYARKNLEASHPEVQKEFAEMAFDTARYFAGHPAFDACLINSEVRDGSQPSFGSGVEPAMFKKFAGYDIPASITGKSLQPYQADKNFPWDRVIKSDRRDLYFLRWFWKEGDGWNPLQGVLSEALHKAVQNQDHKKRFFTFYDPATRTPPLWGSGGNVDMISQWTYTYPDPIRIGQTTDEVIAMAQGNPRQKIASMTQAIWYRSQTAPVNQKVENPPEWLQQEPQATFISIAPDSLSEAFWVKISRRLDAIMYHGVGSLIERTDHKGYRFTNDQSREVLKKLCQTVVQPLGPVLKRVPERPAEMAILESFASSQYAPGHFPMGWGKGWVADLHLALQWAHFQPAIIYDEHLLSDRNTDQLKVLFVPGLEVISEDILQKLNQLRKRNVIIIGDEFTTPALMLDYRLKSVQRQNNTTQETKNALQKLGREIADVLAKHYQSTVKASNQDLIVRSRGSNNADYIFTANDKRTFGNYIGQWKLVPEKGLPNSGIINVNHPAKAAYDLVKHKAVKLNSSSKSCSFSVDLAPGGGTIILLLDREIANVRLTLPAEVERGSNFTITAAAVDNADKNINAILPMEISLQSADGKLLPGSGFYAAENGKLTLQEIMAPNAPAGKVKVVCRDLAGGKTAEKVFTVK